ncbi:MAG: 6-bladed beta-propeller [Bacteroidales bacterium]|jgi:hypothetical protein|nr:6-bladed beta-propeller [Bacteroidales bacterium]
MKKCIAILFVSVLVSCNTSTKQTEFDATKIIFSLNANNLVDYAAVSPVIDSVVFIPLKHPSSESFIGQIDKIVITENHIAIMDVRYKKLNLYNTNGEYLTGIGGAGNGPHEYIGLSDFQIHNDTVYLLDNRKSKIMAYSTDNQFLFQKELPFQADIFTVLDNSLWLWGLASYNTGQYQNAQLILTDKNYNLLEQYAKYDEEKIDPNYEMTYYFIQTDKMPVYHRGLDNNVYFFESNGTLSECIYFDFKEYNVTGEYLKNTAKLIGSNRNYCFLATTPLLTATHIMGILNLNGELYSFVMEKTTGKTAINGLRNYNPLQLSLPVSLNNGTVVSYFNSILFPSYGSVDFLDNTVEACLDGGDYVLIRYYLAQPFF